MVPGTPKTSDLTFSGPKLGPETIWGGLVAAASGWMQAAMLAVAGADHGGPCVVWLAREPARLAGSGLSRAPNLEPRLPGEAHAPYKYPIGGMGSHTPLSSSFLFFSFFPSSPFHAEAFPWSGTCGIPCPDLGALTEQEPPLLPIFLLSPFHAEALPLAFPWSSMGGIPCLDLEALIEQDPPLFLKLRPSPGLAQAYLADEVVRTVVRRGGHMDRSRRRRLEEWLSMSEGDWKFDDGQKSDDGRKSGVGYMSGQSSPRGRSPTTGDVGPQVVIRQDVGPQGVVQRDVGPQAVVRLALRGGLEERRAFGCGLAERLASGGGLAERQASGGGRAGRQASSGGLAECRSLGGGPAERRALSGVQAGSRASGGGLTECRAFGGGLAEHKASVGVQVDVVPQVVVWQNVGPAVVVRQNIGPQVVVRQNVGPQVVVRQDFGPQVVVRQDVGPQGVVQRDVGPQAVVRRALGGGPAALWRWSRSKEERAISDLSLDSFRLGPLFKEKWGSIYRFSRVAWLVNRWEIKGTCTFEGLSSIPTRENPSHRRPSPRSSRLVRLEQPTKDRTKRMQNLRIEKIARRRRLTISIHAKKTPILHHRRDGCIPPQSGGGATRHPKKNSPKGQRAGTNRKTRATEKNDSRRSKSGGEQSKKRRGERKP
ncbi:hypothetical protein M5K25_020956 [Dendrobium thyrsiflorum]|uniref:Uncharacterized protein n=1 Tax=Dendrobium thyrsiflorum TaxID=117978 RepID=A0ABD0UBA1_DENTH